MRFVVAIFLLLCSFPVFAQGQSDRMIMQGQSKVDPRNIALAKRLAIKDALSSALEKESYAMADQNILLRNAKLLREKLDESGQSFIKDYSLKREENDGSYYKVEISALVKKGLLQQKLQEWGFLGSSSSRSSFVIEDFSNQATRSSMSNLDQNLAFAIRKMGVSATVSQTAGLGQTLKLSGKLIQEKEKSLLVSFVIKDDSSKILDQFSQEFSKREDSSITYGLMAIEILSRSQSIMREKVGGGNQFELVLEKLPDYAAYQNFRQFLFSKSNLFTAIEEFYYAHQKIILSVSYHGNPASLRNVLSGVSLGQATTQVTSVDNQKIVIQVQ
ncbi:MAG: hypothetical protein KDD52_02495 [Bdellovibrionales bacterium]|nr:hypothetical protein [Bdellovibrionales bacterium]